MNSNQRHVTSHTVTTNRKGSVHFYCNRGNCRKGFEKIGELELHRRIHDNNLIECYFCPWAGAIFWSFVLHMNHHFHVRPFKCSYCPEAFYKTGTRKQHEETSHEKILDKYKCVACDHATYSLRMLNHHKHKMHPVK